MRVMRLGRAAIGLMVLLVTAGVAVAQLPRVDTVFPEALPIEFEFRETWEQTYSHYQKVWDNQARSEHRDAARRTLYVDARLLELLRQLLQRDDLTAADRQAMYRLAMGHLGMSEMAAYAGPWLKGAVDESAGDFEMTAEALTLLLAHAQENAAWMPDATKWRDYATRRLIALHRLGYLPAAHPQVLEALRSQATTAMEEGRFLAAARLHALILHHAPRHEPTRVDQARLQLAVGQPKAALGQLEAVDRRHNREVREIVQQANVELDAGRAADFAADEQIGAQLEQLGALGPAQLSRLLPNGETAALPVVMVGEDWARGSWPMLEARLRALDGEQRRAMGETAADIERQLRRAVRQQDAAALLGLYRMQPWTSHGHEALLHHGQLELQRGHRQAAGRSFEQLLAWSPSESIAQQARLGLLLADPRARLDVAGEHELPWYDGVVRVDALRQRLGVDDGEGASVATSRLALPSGFDDARIVALADGWIAISHEAAARLDAEGEVRWIRMARDVWPDGSEMLPAREVVVAGGEPRGVAGEAVTVVAWPPTDGHGRPTELVGIAGDDGRTLWTSGADDWWAQRRPIGQPALVNGRLYGAAVDAGGDEAARGGLWLVCLDASSGRRVWQTRLGSVAEDTVALPGTAWRGQRVDLVTNGAAVAVDDGAVYLNSAAGLVVRCDARDGMVEWVRRYERSPMGPDLRTLVEMSRMTPPVVVGSRVVLAPRDRVGVFTLDAATGALEAFDPLLPGGHLLATDDGRAIGGRGRELAMWEPASGQATWVADSGESVDDLAVVNRRLLVLSGGRVRMTSVIDGRLTDHREQFAQPALVRAADAPSVAALADITAAEDTGGLTTMADVTEIGPELSGSRVRMPGVSGRLWVAPGSAPRVYAVRPGGLAAIDVQQTPQVRWQATWATETRDEADGYGAGDIRPIVMQQGVIYLLEERQLVAVDDQQGQVVFRAPLPASAERLLRLDDQIIVARLKPGGYVAAFDRIAGEQRWLRSLDAFGPQSRFDALGLHANRLQLLARLAYRGAGKNGDFHRIAIDPSDGAIRGIDLLIENLPREPKAVFPNGRYAWLAISDRQMVRIDLDRPDAQQAVNVDLRDLDQDRLAASEAVDEFWRLSQLDANDRRSRHWLISVREPGRALLQKHRAVLRNGWLFELDRNVVHVVDMQKRGRVASLRVNAIDGNVRSVFALDAWSYATGFLLAAVQLDRDTDRAWLTLHRYTRQGKGAGDAAVFALDGDEAERLLASRAGPLTEPTPWVYHAGVLLLSSGGEVVGVEAGKALRAVEQTPPLIRKAAEPIVIDGRPDDWPNDWSVATDAKGQPVVWQVRRDGERLAIAVRYFDPAIQRTTHNDGDMLSLMLRHGGRHVRLTAALGPAGPVVRASRDNDSPRDGGAYDIDAAIGGEIRDLVHTYEIALPIHQLFGRSNEATETIQFIAVLWDSDYQHGRHPLAVLPAPGGRPLRWPVE